MTLRRKKMVDPLIRELFNEAAAIGMTNTELAERAGYDRKTVTDIKYQHHVSTYTTLQNIGAVLGLELVWRKKEEAGSASS